MLFHLSGHRRSDISYAVNCCARCIFNPKVSHEKTLKRIGRYFKAIRTGGLVSRPSGGLMVESYSDGMPTKELASMHVSMHEDNSSALVLAQTLPPQFTPRNQVLCQQDSVVSGRSYEERDTPVED